MVVPPLSDSNSDGGAVLISDVTVVGALRAESTATAVVDTTTTGRKVSKELFGVNFGTGNTSSFSANRWGGNAVTRYSWDLDVQNRASDFFFENIANPLVDNTSSSDRFIASTLARGAMPVITIPAIGFTPIDQVKRCGFSIAKYGPQKQHDQYDTDCGNGIHTDGSKVVGNAPADTSKVVGPEYAVAWVQHLVQYHGPEVVNKSVFILDNEPNYWSGTHRDVHPADLTYAELWNYTVRYAVALKEAFPGIRLAGPDTSSFDAISKFVEQFVADVDAYEQKTGVRLIDVLDIHCYPEASYDASRMDAALDVTIRMRLHRELWDSSFYLESWNAKPAYYLRRLRNLAPAWLSMSCTEWNYQKGFNDDDVVGAVISLDALAVYAREGVELATKWSAPRAGTVMDYALLQFLNNFDQQGSGIAGSSYLNISTSSDMIGAHGFMSAEGQLCVLLIGRQVQKSVDVDVQLPKGVEDVSVYRLDAVHTQPGGAEKVTAAQGMVSINIPAVSAALVVVAKSTPAPAPAPAGATCNGCGYVCDADCNCGHCNTKPGCMSESMCLSNCNSGQNAKWCGGSTPAPPAPPSPPTPPSSECPGGSLSACIGLCPSSPAVAFQACVQDCTKRCT